MLVRSVQPEDKALIADAFDRLSPMSRYRRFLHHKVSLSRRELAFLTELDGVRHYALGVISDDGVPMGIGRLVRLCADASPGTPDQSELGSASTTVASSEPASRSTHLLGVGEAESPVAEIAVTVMDEHQGRGVGRLMIEHLLAAARERGIERVQLTFLYDNEPMRGLIRALLGETRVVQSDGPAITVEGDVPAVASGPATVAHPLAHWRRAMCFGWQSQLNAAQRWAQAVKGQPR